MKQAIKILGFSKEIKLSHESPKRKRTVEVSKTK
jgi:hypothetical protein